MEQQQLLTRQDAELELQRLVTEFETIVRCSNEDEYGDEQPRLWNELEDLTLRLNRAVSKLNARTTYDEQVRLIATELATCDGWHVAADDVLTSQNPRLQRYVARAHVVMRVLGLS